LPNNDLAFAGQLSPLQAERTASSPDAERLETTLARVRHIVGRENVGSPYLLNTHRPDRFVMHPFRPHMTTEPTSDNMGKAIPCWPPNAARVSTGS